ncbi:hypothetical protein HID58_018875 [Brassica napus]|uniref:BUD13 homolog n=1 Tax=Brassica napus TaxID=3708 RepID=A0ABQ8DB86_BRANA|nr:hypothetical protein HID58_018875 [Brassica napus]
MAASRTGVKSMKDYLKKYESSEVIEKKKKKPSKPEPTGVLVVDEDPVWQKQVDPHEEDNENYSAEERPVVDEDIEVKRMRRLEEIKARRAQNAIAEDGSGWVSLSSDPQRSDDISPPRRHRTRNDSPSPEPGGSRGSLPETDMSPPRRRKRHYTPSPEPNRLHAKPVSLDSDLTPPRKRRARNDSPSPEPEDTAPKSLDSLELDGDLSPPRRKKDSLVSDVNKRSNDLSPPRRRRYHSPSPEPGRRPSKSLGSNSDLSPPRRSLSTKETAQRITTSPNKQEQRKTGLISGKDIGSEYRKKKQDEQLRFKNMDSELTGQNAEAVFRDKITGKRISKEEYLQSKQKKVIEKPKEIKLEWGQGLAQKRDAEARLQELELEKDKPFARTRYYIKKQYEAPLMDLGDNEEMKKSGFVIPQSIPKHSWITRGLEAAPNRYGIKPGRHWDGVDRSTGHEKDRFKKTSEKKQRKVKRTFDNEEF